jgi:RNA polymerase sigma-70 factor, ECF subfamily
MPFLVPIEFASMTPREQSIEDVARIVGIPEATVKTRMFYARRQMSELLRAAGIDRGWP